MICGPVANTRKSHEREDSTCRE